ncbi:MAG: hypothetical protein AUG83_07740 [Acidobacteria bacterium 13_1_20CM_4_57_11]|nr:MAG: hypothetical protein AUG83_07740 [Acidobacteria bacterium 13_1_20CM_4_57_11]
MEITAKTVGYERFECLRRGSRRLIGGQFPHFGPVSAVQQKARPRDALLQTEGKDRRTEVRPTERERKLD